ncbi:MAG TPA: hypothetical protein VI727_09250 [Candidatus Brocadiaceae bacterium]|nr:hypothetical protein [Candidatus Brocadiaceae bacterium]
MAIGLGDIYEKLKELITLTDKVRENTEEIKEIKRELVLLRKDMEKGFSDSKGEMAEMKGDIKVILSQLKTEERMDSLESMLREHILACEKVKA